MVGLTHHASLLSDLLAAAAPGGHWLLSWHPIFLHLLLLLCCFCGRQATGAHPATKDASKTLE
jgi:hypothetical protein